MARNQNVQTWARLLIESNKYHGISQCFYSENYWEASFLSRTLVGSLHLLQGASWRQFGFFPIRLWISILSQKCLVQLLLVLERFFAVNVGVLNMVATELSTSGHFKSWDSDDVRHFVYRVKFPNQKKKKKKRLRTLGKRSGDSGFYPGDITV